MKGIVIACIILLFSAGASMAEEAPARGAESFKRFSITLSADHTRSENKDGNAFGVCFEIFVTGNLSLNYNFVFGSRQGVPYGFTNAGFAGGLYCFGSLLDASATDNSDDENDNQFAGAALAGLLVAAVPEGVSYHIPAGHDMWLVPYINPLGYTFTEDGGTMASGVGVKIKQNIGNTFFVSPNFGIKYLYSFGTVEYNAGIGVGFRF